MKKYYRVYNFSTEISEIEVSKETEHTIWYKGKSGTEQQRRKNTYNEKYFETFTEAKVCMIIIHSDNVDLLKYKLKIAIETLEKVKSLTQ